MIERVKVVRSPKVIYKEAYREFSFRSCCKTDTRIHKSLKLERQAKTTGVCTGNVQHDILYI